MPRAAVRVCRIEWPDMTETVTLAGTSLLLDEIDQNYDLDGATLTWGYGTIEWEEE